MFFGADRPAWATDGADWPNRSASRVVSVDGLDWHVQVMGEGPDLLLLHGTGASSHSWRDVAPLLAAGHRVVAPDLPGHGFTAMPGNAGLSLRGMAASLARLLSVLDCRPVAGVGHSAGAALLAAMVLQDHARFRAIVSINGAFLPIRHAGLFGPLARLLFLNPLAPRMFALRGASPSAVRRLIEGTGSTLDARGIELYRRLMSRSGHVAGALGMMGNWELEWLSQRLDRLDVPLWLVTAPDDLAVPPGDADRVCAKTSAATRIRFPHGGHLAHEEFPLEMAALVLDLLYRKMPGRDRLSHL